MSIEAKFYIGGHFIDGEQKQNVLNKFTNEVCGIYPLADDELVSMGLTSACEALGATEAVPTHKRADILDFISYSLVQDETKFAQTIAIEAGKPIRQALAEVRRAQQTFRFAASCIRSNEGGSIRLDAAVGSENKYGFYFRVPAGIVVAISPFNFPLNLVAHKIAPAIAAGCPVILKPASYTPLTAYLLAEIIAKSDLPYGAFNLIFGPGHSVGMSLVRSDLVRAISFTGSAEVGHEIAKSAGIKRLILELGSNSAAIVEQSCDLDNAISKICKGAFSYSGQVCISVQRVFISESIFDTFQDKLISAASRIISGNPLDEKSDIGPMISENDAQRVELLVEEAADNGAKIILGGTRNGAFYEPTILTKTRPDMKVMKNEIFGPVVCLVPFRDFDEAIVMVNDSAYGLQAGVFSKNIDNINQAIHKLKVGGVIINDAPTYRADHMPYGGVKMSGLGREGLRYAIEELTDIRMIAIQR